MRQHEVLEKLIGRFEDEVTTLIKLSERDAIRAAVRLMKRAEGICEHEGCTQAASNEVTDKSGEVDGYFGTARRVPVVRTCDDHVANFVYTNCEYVVSCPRCQLHFGVG